MKFYVKSNTLQVVVDGPHILDAKQAACEAFLMRYVDGMYVSQLVLVSERGFDFFNHEHYEDKVYDTCDILKTAGFSFGDE